MRTINNGDAPEAKWIELPDGGSLQLRQPTWEDRDRAVTRAANDKDGAHDITDVTRELIIGLLVDQKEFELSGKGGAVVIPDHSKALVGSLSIADVRALETVIYPVLAEADTDLGN